MNNISNAMASHINVHRIGNEQLPLLVIDDFYPDCQSLRNIAYKNAHLFRSQKHDYYPGKRLSVPTAYQSFVVDRFTQYVQKCVSTNTSVTCLNGQLSVVSQDPTCLLPIQTIPHFDALETKLWAGVHYLSNESQNTSKVNGTGFFRHRNTGYESVNTQRSHRYFRTLEDESAKHGFPEKAYIQGSTELFELIHHVEFKINRAIFYPANILHSGLINNWQFNTIDEARLTANCLLSI